MILILVVDRTNPLFTQWRVGKNGVPFRFYKLATLGNYRSMEPSRGSSDVRATHLGQLLRWLILDEVPQIAINVLKGDMSLVGPRPLLQADIDLMRERLSSEDFSQWYTVYTTITPGWTGRFGVSSRRFKIQSDEYLHARKYYDLLYMQKASWRMDIRTILVHAALPFLDVNRSS